MADGICANVAVTDRFELIATAQVGPAPLQSPPQPVNVVPPTPAAVSWTLVPAVYSCVQSPGQSMPVPVTRPLPVTETVRSRLLGGTGANAVVTDLSAVITTAQVAAAPLQLPPQPVKLMPVPGDAVSWTLVPEGYCCVQSPGQSIPLPVTRPVPFTVTVNVRFVEGVGAKVAVTDRSPSRVRPHLAAVPLQSPPQPVKLMPAPGVATRPTLVPAGYCSLQSPGQSMPLPVTLPVPSTTTVRVLGA